MSAPQASPPTAQTARIIHGAMAAGVIMFAIVAHFVLVPKASPERGLAGIMPILLGLALALCVVALLLSTRVPRPADEDTANTFWKAAASQAIIAWALLEGAGLLAVVLYSLTASRAAIAIAGVAVFILVLLNPRYFESR